VSGAVCFGLDNTVVSTRRSRLTYGAGVLKRFVRGQHPDAKLLRRDGSDWCRDVFDPYVVVDQVRSSVPESSMLSTRLPRRHIHPSVSLHFSRINFSLSLKDDVLVAAGGTTG